MKKTCQASSQVRITKTGRIYKVLVIVATISSIMNMEFSKMGPLGTQTLPTGKCQLAELICLSQGTDIWAGCDPNSKLKIPFPELKESYMKHLLLKGKN